MTNTTPDKTVAYFSRWAKTYDDTPLKRWFTTVHQEVIRAVDPQATDNILDVACGTGKALRAMAAQVTAGRLAGVDLSQAMIAEARSLAAEIPNLEFQEGAADQLPFADGSFNHVTAMNAFHHFPDQPKALREMVRVLKPGGRVYIADITGHVLPFPIAGNKVWNLIEWPLTPQVNALSRRQFRTLFQSVGLTNIRQLPASQSFRRSGRYWLAAGLIQLAAAYFWLPLLACGAITAIIGAGISFPYLSKTITVGEKPS